MKTYNFKNRLSEVTQKIKQENEKSLGKNLSYLWLLNILNKIDTIEDVEKEADKILYFLSDSYEGDKEINDIVGKFVLPFSSLKKKRK